MSWKVLTRPLLLPLAMPGQAPGLSWEDSATGYCPRPDSVLPLGLAGPSPPRPRLSCPQGLGTLRKM